MPKQLDKLWNDLSDESSFYGNDEERSRLEELVRNDVLESSSSKPARKSKSKPKAKPAMSAADTDSDVEVISPPREWSSRKKGKASATDAKPAPKPKNVSSEEPSESEDSEPAPAKKSIRKKGRVEDRSSTDSDTSSPEPKKKAPTKKRKADSHGPETSDSASPPKKKPAREPESPGSTESGTPSPSPSPSEEQSPDETREPEPNQADESTDDPDESDSDQSSNPGLEYYPDEADIVFPPPNVNLMSQRRPNQSMSNLVASMPPSTSNMWESGPWIFVKNPHYRGPPATNPTSFYIEASETIMGGHYPGMPMRRQGGSGGSSAEMARTRDFMERGILALARRQRLVTGKWMFFLTPDRVDYAWNVIAQATERGELGPESKVATDDGSGKARLIAVYTKNFDDVADVRRVAQRLVQLGLIRSYDRPIYYKADAYTILDITSNNPWGLKASMYNSRDILAQRF